MKWEELSFKERAEYIKTGVKNGLRDINDIKGAYNKFQNGGPIDGDELEVKGSTFEEWRSNLPINLRSTDENLYNLRGAYEGGVKPRYNIEDGYYHLSTRNPKTGEILKKPLHPTFLKGLIEDSRLGYYPYNKDGKIYTDTWKGNELSGERNLYGFGSNLKKRIGVLTDSLVSYFKSEPESEFSTKTISPKIDIQKPLIYSVKSGDSLSKIAKQNNVKLSDILKYNSDIKDINKIQIGQQILLSPEKKDVQYKNLKEYNNEKTYNNIEAIQSVAHEGNYVIINKKDSNLTVFNRDNNPIYTTDQINTGASGDDYNTITYTDEKGNIKNMQGNNSTPAGITTITGIGTYHGVPSFTRGRYKGNSDEVEDIASSLHFGIITKGKGSNGCVRIGGQQLKELSNYLELGTKIYTLPEKGGSKFTVTQGKLNYTATNPYGKDVKGDKQRYWDDYNVHTDKSYSPLRIDIKNYDNSVYSKNKEKFVHTLVHQKQKLQKELGLSSSTYNNLVQLALGIAEQESKFNTADRKKFKDTLTDTEINIAKFIKGRKAGARSYGYTQIKLDGDNEETQKLYKKFGIDKNNIDNADKSALATMLRLYSIYKNEVVGRNFEGKSGEKINEYDALLYKWMGRNKELVNKTAAPKDNIYINNVNKYKNNFEYYSGNMNSLGGNLFQAGGFVDVTPAAQWGNYDSPESVFENTVDPVAAKKAFDQTTSNIFNKIDYLADDWEDKLSAAAIIADGVAVGAPIAGAVVGSVVPGVGTAAGAGAGLTVGLGAKGISYGLRGLGSVIDAYQAARAGIKTYQLLNNANDDNPNNDPTIGDLISNGFAFGQNALEIGDNWIPGLRGKALKMLSIDNPKCRNMLQQFFINRGFSPSAALLLVDRTVNAAASSAGDFIDITNHATIGPTVKKAQEALGFTSEKDTYEITKTGNSIKNK